MSAATDATMILPNAVLPERALRAMASAVKVRWRNGERPDALRAVAELPALRYAKSIQLDLAYEEYCLRREAGESLDVEEFCDRFPHLKASLRRLVEAHELLEERPELLDEQSFALPEPGDTFLGFELIEELGRGAFARVYLAREKALGNRLVALKIAPHGWAEADILGRLQHPNIVPVFSVTNDLDSPLTAVCMPYRGRATLCDVLDHLLTMSAAPRRADAIVEAIRLAGGSWNLSAEPAETGFQLRGQPYEQAVLRIGAMLADALAYAHGLGVLHRDLKPSNVLLTAEGWPLLLDFNLACDTHGLSHTVGGTLPYMAPEQLQAIDPMRIGNGLEVGPQADLFSLGVILYELLTRRHPFAPLPEGGSLASMRANLLARQRQGPAPLRQWLPQCDPQLEQLLQRLLAFRPEERPESAAEVAEQLRQLLKPRRRTLATVCGVVALLAAAGLAVSSFTSREVEVPDNPAQASAVPVASFTDWLSQGRQAYEEGRYGDAVHAFSQALASASRPEDRATAAFYRGRAYQRQLLLHNEPQACSQALADFQLSEQIQPSAKTRACMAHCLCLLTPPQLAPAEHYLQQCVAENYATAEVLNNLACVLSQESAQLWKALQLFDAAAAAKPNVALIRYNRAVAKLQLFYLSERPDEERNGASAPYSAVDLLLGAAEDILTALELGPATPEMHREAARILVRLGELDPQVTERARKHLKIALRRGTTPESIRGDWALHPLLDAEALALIETVNPNCLRSCRLLDPLDGHLE